MMTAPQHQRPLWLGVLLAPVVAPLFLSIFMPPFASDYFSGVAALFAVSFPIGLIAVLVVGLPYVLWLRSRGKLNALRVCLGAIGVGVITIAILNLGFNWGHRPPGMLQLAYGAGFGLLGGIAFCAGAGIWKGRNASPSNNALERERGR